MARAVFFFVRACVCMARAVLFFVRAFVCMACAVLFFVRASVLKSLSLKKGRTQSIWDRGVIYCGLLSFIMVYRLFSIFGFLFKTKNPLFSEWVLACFTNKSFIAL
jgi:hypothetical protein